MSAPRSVLLVDDEEDVRNAVGQSLELEGFDVATFARPERALALAARDLDAVVVSDIRMPRMDGMALLDAVREIDAELPVVLMTGHGDVPLAVDAMRRGAYDFIEKPFSAARLVEVVRRAAELRRLTLENRAIRAELASHDPVEGVLIGRAPGMVELRHRLRAVAASDADVLVLGETGTGKELAARVIHAQSERSDRPFVAVNLAALPEGLIESELFGHEAGAIAGSPRARTGKFEHARGGTLFLDEVGAAPLALQAKLLRVIEERSIERIGSNERIDLNVRFVASSNDDLPARAEAGDFRPDLFYRLAVVTLQVPPLRERAEDAPRLFNHLVAQAALRHRRDPPEVTADVLRAVAARDWPGNVRELRNAADRFVLGLGLEEGAEEERGVGTLADRVEAFERAAIAAALSANGGELKATYESLGLSRKTLYDKMQRHGLRREDFGAGEERVEA